METEKTKSETLGVCARGALAAVIVLLLYPWAAAGQDGPSSGGAGGRHDAESTDAKTAAQQAANRDFLAYASE